MLPRLKSRQTPSHFEPNGYFKFENDALPGSWLNMGAFGPANVAQVNVSEIGYSSENWQLFFQSGVYFIRNYDHFGDWQLGVEESSPWAPRMRRRSGALGQQWTITKVEGKEGVYTLSNGLLGPEFKFGISPANESTLPTMYPSELGARWYISINLSELTRRVRDPKMLQEVEDFEIATSSSSGSSSTTFSTRITSEPTTRITSLPLQPSTLSDSTSRYGLRAGPIAGIAVGGVTVLVAMILFIWYLLARRKKRAPKCKANPMIFTEKRTELEVYEQRLELAHRPSVKEKDGRPI